MDAVAVIPASCDIDDDRLIRSIVPERIWGVYPAIFPCRISVENNCAEILDIDLFSGFSDRVFFTGLVRNKKLLFAGNDQGIAANYDTARLGSLCLKRWTRHDGKRKQQSRRLKVKPFGL